MNEKLLDEFIDIVKSIDNFFVIIGGDSFENAVIGSKSSVFDEKLHGIDAITYLTEKLLPIKDRILYVGSGNHDFTRSMTTNKIPPSAVLAYHLGVPFFRSFGSVFLNCRKNQYTIFTQHSGKKVENIEWVQANIHIHEHKHEHNFKKNLVAEPNKYSKGWIVRPVFHLQGGSYLSWGNNYASDKMYRPNINGSLIAELSGNKWNVNVFDNIDLFKRVVKCP